MVRFRFLRSRKASDSLQPDGTPRKIHDATDGSVHESVCESSAKVLADALDSLQ